MAFLLFNKERGMEGGREEDKKRTSRVKAYLFRGREPQREDAYDRLLSYVVRWIVM